MLRRQRRPDNITLFECRRPLDTFIGITFKLVLLIFSKKFIQIVVTRGGRQAAIAEQLAGLFWFEAPVIFVIAVVEAVGLNLLIPEPDDPFEGTPEVFAH